MNAFSEPIGAPERAPVHHYHQRLLNRDYALIYKAIKVYNRAYSRTWSDYTNRNHWSRVGKVAPPADWESRYPVDPYSASLSASDCAVWRSNTGVTVILRDGLGYLVASYEVHTGRLTRIH